MSKSILFDQFYNRVKKEPEKYYNDYLKIKEIIGKSSAIYRGEPVKFPYQAFFYSNEDLETLKNFCWRFIEIFKKVIKEYRRNPAFRKFFDFPELMEELILVDPGYQIEFPVARFDVFYSFDDKIKFCEINTDGSSAMNEVRVLGDAMARSLIIEDLSRDNHLSGFELFDSWLEALLLNYREFLEYIGGSSIKKEQPPKIAIVDFKGEGTTSEFREFQQRFIKKGYDTIICDPRELEYRKGNLYFRHFKIDLIYRRATTIRLVEEAKDIQDFIEAYRDRAVCVVGGLVSQVIHNKVLFAILHDRKKVPFLYEEEYSLIKKHVPYTTILKEDRPFLEEVREYRENYLIKPPDGCAAKGVLAGRDYSLKKWDGILSEASNLDYLVQEYVDVPKMEMAGPGENGFCFEDYRYLTGLFLYNQELKGIYTRAGRKSIIGAAQESFTVPGYLVD